MARMKVLIDTDPGVDDALAILMAHAHADVAALSIAAGNVGLHHTMANALKLVETIGAATPVFGGCAAPLVQPAEDAAFVHGKDGFGDPGYLPSARAAEGEACRARLTAPVARACRQSHTVVAMAPLTNLALALQIDPTLPQRVARLVIMGGAVTGRGNTRRVPAESIGFDPEAAHVVFSSWPQFTLVDWEGDDAPRYRVRTHADLARCRRPRARFFAAISRKTRDGRAVAGRPRLLVADAWPWPWRCSRHRPAAGAPVCRDRTRRHADPRRDRGRLGKPPPRGGGQRAVIVLDVDQLRFEALIAAGAGRGVGRRGTARPISVAACALRSCRRRRRGLDVCAPALRCAATNPSAEK